MSRRLPPLNALRTFEVAARHLNFRAASEELGVTQSAVAQQIRLLEDHLGLALFHRLPRGLALTPQGASYATGIAQAFRSIEKATTDLQAHPQGVTLSVTPTFAAKVLLPKLGEFAAAFPKVELRTLATEALSDFERDHVDIAVRLSKGPFPAHLEAHVLVPQDLVIVASPLLDLGGKTLAELPLLHDAHNHWSQVLGPNAPQTGPRFNQTALAIEAAVAGQGLALACLAYVKADLAAGRLVIASPQSARVSPDIYLVRRRSPEIPPLLEAIWQWCLQHLR